MRHKYEAIRRFGRFGAVVTGLAFLTIGCDDLLTVQDPGQFTDEDLDLALDAVANGVEGDVYGQMGTYVIHSALLSDEYRHTGTWAGYDEFDKGRITYGNSGGNGFTGVVNTWLRTRTYAQEAVERFERVLGENEARTSPLTVRVRSMEAFIDLMLGSAWCEAPAEPVGPAVSDTELLQQAVSKLTDAIALANGAGESEWATFNTALRARANLLLGNHGAALGDAQQVPDGYEHVAFVSGTAGGQANSIVTLTTRGYNHAAGLREKWWPLVDQSAGRMRDPWTDELDSRLPVHHTGSELGVNGFTPHFSQMKYTERGSSVPITHGGEMRLIEAEVYWQQGDLAAAQERMNYNRARYGLSPLPDSSDPDQVLEYLLHERFAQMFMEGQRHIDLHRFGLVREMSITVDGEQVFGPDRPSKFPMSPTEALNNPNIEDSAAARCLPRGGA